MTQPRLEHRTRSIKQLVDDYRAGRVVVPEFQREYVWRPSKAPRLLDSIYRGFPISSLLLWQSTDDVRSRMREPRFRHRSGAVSWLIDGQQRVMTLSKALAGDDGIDVVFDPVREEFMLANAATKRDPAWYHIADILESESYLRLRRNLDGTRHAERLEERFERLRSVLDYEVPVVEMVDHSFGDAVMAFTRINTLGVRLKKEDIQSAQVAAKHSGLIAEEIAPFLRKMHQHGFHRLSVMQLFRACAFIARPDGRKRTPLHELDRKEVLGAWKSTVKATEQAISLIRSELGLVNMNILWSGALLVPLIAICASTPPRERNGKELIGWLALATLRHRYSVSSETALEQDLRACREADPVRALLSNLRSGRSSLLAVPKDFAGSLNDRSGLLALYIACMNRGIVDFFSHSKVLLQGNVDRHHILPRGQFPEKQRASADTIANIAFVTDSVNRSIGQSGPEVYLRKVKPKDLASQCIPLDEALWRVDQAEEFWNRRRELLAESFNSFIGKMLPQRRL